jgi:hypothetical protein
MQPYAAEYGSGWASIFCRQLRDFSENREIEGWNEKRGIKNVVLQPATYGVSRGEALRLLRDPERSNE